MRPPDPQAEIRKPSALLPLALAAFLAATSGCIVLNPGHAPGPTLTFREPETNRTYRLYVPSTYSPERSWPLMVACHGAPPFDSAAFQIDEWKGLAEAKGFLVLAPDLISTAGDLSKDPAPQIARQRQDEEAILAAITHVRASRNVDTDHVFIAAWTGGAYPALFTGLRNPHIFRVIALRQPAFDPRFVEVCIPYIDQQQPVYIIYGPGDLAHDRTLACGEWLRRNRVYVEQQEVTNAHVRNPEPLYIFVRNVVRSRPWIRVVVTEPDVARPLTVKFTLWSTVPVVRYLWEFGDGQTANVAEPVHTYEKPGVYTVRVAIESGGKRYLRQLEFRVPRTRLGTTRPAMP